MADIIRRRSQYFTNLAAVTLPSSHASCISLIYVFSFVLVCFLVFMFSLFIPRTDHDQRLLDFPSPS